MLSRLPKILRNSLILVLGFVACDYVASSLFSSKNDIILSSVMVTNIDGTHGGSGVILESQIAKSKILTNSHVCGVVEQGGMVKTHFGDFLVSSYKKSEIHDLCLITVDADLHINTKVADRAPVLYYEEATISGHPSLLPTVITKGHFSGRRSIEVVTGMRKCTAEDLNDINKALLCLFAGGIPEVKRYESVLVTATIMPGSSGSPIYNKDLELSGLVFAGKGELAYAWTVPYEAMINFLKVEAKTLPEQKPDAIMHIWEDKKSSDFAVAKEKLKEICADPTKNSQIKDTCKALENE